MKNSKLGILLLGIIIGVIVVLGGLLATGTISFKDTVQSNDTKKANDIGDVDDNVNDDDFTEEEAITIAKGKVKYLFTNSAQNPCGDGAYFDDSVGVSSRGLSYYRSKDYHSFEELKSALLKDMSEEVIAKLYNHFNKDYYLEKDGVLYCEQIGRGILGTIDFTKAQYYNVRLTSNDTFEITVSAQVEYDDSSEERKYDITMMKKNGNWIITNYSEQQ